MFWKTYPLLDIIRSKWNREIFKDLQFEREPVYRFDVVIANRVDSKEIKTFLKNYFGNPPKKPILNIPEDKLCGEKDIILYIKEEIIIGCIRYHYIGTFLDKEIYCVDCFCIHPLWRKKGVGDHLLTMLHVYANKNNIPYAMFLKEGYLNIINMPLYSSVYVYRKIKKSNHSVISLTIEEAYKLIDMFCECNQMVVIKNSNNKNQHWKLYKNGIYKVLACIQDTYQEFNSNKIGFITGWIESPFANLCNNIREDASKQISDSMYGTFDYIWGNKKWIGNSKEWNMDGSFHWYSYQWTTNININHSYCILI